MLDFFGNMWSFVSAHLLFFVIGSIFVSNATFSVLLKESNNESRGRPQKFLFTMLCAFGISIIGATLLNVFFTNAVIKVDALALFTGLGILNALAAYSEWKATEISLSKKGLFSFWGSLLAMALAYQYLGEGKQMTGDQLVGIALSVAAAVLFAVHEFYKQHRQEDPEQGMQDKRRITLSFYAFVLAFNLIWGIATFLSKKYSQEGVPVETWILGWYGGSVIGALIIVCGIRLHDRKHNRLQAVTSLSSKEVLMTLAMAVFMVGWVFGFYFLYSIYPLMVLQSLLLVIGMINSLWIGLVMYKERRKIDRIQALLYVLALIGGILVARGLYLTGKS